MLLKVFVQIFYLAVVLRMIRAGERFVNTQQLAHFRECFRLEITALIAMNAVRHTRSADPVPHRHLCRGPWLTLGTCQTSIAVTMHLFGRARPPESSFYLH